MWEPTQWTGLLVNNKGDFRRGQKGRYVPFACFIVPALSVGWGDPALPTLTGLASGRH